MSAIRASPNITIVDMRHAFVLGKRFGATNLIALGSNKSIVVTSGAGDGAPCRCRYGLPRFLDVGTIPARTSTAKTRSAPGDPKTYFEQTEGWAIEHEVAGVAGAAPGN